jgi:hypothetical protein
MIITLTVTVDPTALPRESLDMALSAVLDMALSATRPAEGSILAADGVNVAAHWAFHPS